MTKQFQFFKLTGAQKKEENVNDYNVRLEWNTSYHIYQKRSQKEHLKNKQ